VPDGRADGWLAAIRADPGRAGGIALAAVAALAVLITVFTLTRHHPAPVVSANLPKVEPVSALATSVSAPSSSSAPEPHPQQLVVSVVGLVRQPGLVTVAPDARVADAVTAAGGTLHGADTLGLNLARHLADGEQIVVGIAAPAGRPGLRGSSVRGGSPGGDPAQSGPPAGPATPAGPVDLNSATVEQLDALPGVGPVTAAAIVAWRSANGRFSSVDQLGEIDGIGPARLEKLRPLVRI
jgi:competence protein ComEA